MALLGLAWKPPWAGAVSAPLKAPYLSFRSVSQLPPFPPPFPVINTCPSPTCSCAATPGGLDIDHARPLSGTMPAYNQHVVICTGQDDWPSRIEDDTARGFFAQRPLARLLKNQLGPKGPLHNPYNNVMITNSSFPVYRGSWALRGLLTSVYVFPRFQYLATVPHIPPGAEALIRGFLLGPNQAGRAADAKDAGFSEFTQYCLHGLTREVSDVIVLICGHGGRDQRCGVMGPLLGAEFSRLLADRGVDTSGGDGKGFPPVEDIDDSVVRARVGLISHIGGHAFAGNVIIYVPPSFKVDGKRSPLAGKGIWYGRVEPKHVEGIIEETIFRGNVIADLFRGGIEQGGNILRL